MGENPRGEHGERRGWARGSSSSSSRVLFPRDPKFLAASGGTLYAHLRGNLGDHSYKASLLQTEASSAEAEFPVQVLVAKGTCTGAEL